MGTGAEAGERLGWAREGGRESRLKQEGSLRPEGSLSVRVHEGPTQGSWQPRAYRTLRENSLRYWVEVDFGSNDLSNRWQQPGGGPHPWHLGSLYSYSWAFDLHKPRAPEGLGEPCVELPRGSGVQQDTGPPREPRLCRHA